MADVTFRRTEPGACPRYKDYYVQDRYTGKNVYGHDTYEYALFKKCPFVTIDRFRRRKQAYEYVARETGVTKETEKYTNRVIREQGWVAVYNGADIWKIIKRTNEVQHRPEQDLRITGWMQFAECLDAAKAYIEQIEQENKPC